MIRTIRPLDRPDPGLERVAKANGFSLHTGVSCEAHQKETVTVIKAVENAGHDALEEGTARFTLEVIEGLKSSLK